MLDWIFGAVKAPFRKAPTVSKPEPYMPFVYEFAKLQAHRLVNEHVFATINAIRDYLQEQARQAKDKELSELNTAMQAFDTYLLGYGFQMVKRENRTEEYSLTGAELGLFLQTKMYPIIGSGAIKKAIDAMMNELSQKEYEESVVVTEEPAPAYTPQRDAQASQPEQLILPEPEPEPLKRSLTPTLTSLS